VSCIIVYLIFKVFIIYRISYSPNGWTDRELALEWIKKHFDPMTYEKANGQIWVLLLDGHKSHYSRDLLFYAHKNNIMILGYPPHCTHALQGLDVVCFARIKEVWKEELNSYEQDHNQSLPKSNFVFVFGTAFLHAFTPKTIQAAFTAIGIHPYNPNIILAQQMEPSIPSSTKTTFPLPQPSPVHHIMAIFHDKTPSTPGTISTHTGSTSSINRQANYYQQFVKSFAQITKPIHETVKKERKWSWGEKQQKVFEDLKKVFTTRPVLAVPELDKEFRVEVDASDYATGGVLSVKCEDNKWRPAAFISKGLNETEWNYEVHNKEMLAIIRCLEEWRHFLEGARLQFKIWTDHWNLEHFMKAQKLN